MWRNRKGYKKENALLDYIHPPPPLYSAHVCLLTHTHLSPIVYVYISIFISIPVCAYSEFPPVL